MMPKRRRHVSDTTQVRLTLPLACICVLLGACGDTGSPPPIRGSGGSTGSGGTGGAVGAGGFAGTGGVEGPGGRGGEAGSGGTAGAGGHAGTGGSSGGGGVGGSAQGCVTSALCDACPAEPCSTDSDCDLESLVCVPTGCTFDGEPQKECQPARYISCEGLGDCPPGDYDCRSLDAGPKRCVRNTAGCTAETEDYDCPPGFSCEEGACVDHRVPCDSFVDCPKNHVCFTLPNASTSTFCVSVFRSCNSATDCSQLGADCADVDGDGRTECIGTLDGAACVNADDCAGAPDPVCEAAGTGTTATCGDHGLCRSDTDCDQSAGFECVPLWQDGRKECVRSGGNCASVADCPIQQVCAASRSGDPPSCQAGTAP